MTIFFKLPPNSGHLSITGKFFKTRRCALFRGFTVAFYTHSRKIWNFSRKDYVSNYHALYWSQQFFMSPVTKPNSDYTDNVFMQAWTLRKLETFWCLIVSKVISPKAIEILQNENMVRWSSTLKQIAVISRRIIWVCLTILWGWRSKG